MTLSDFHPRLLLYSFFFFFKLDSKRQRNVLISRIDRFQGRIFALGNFPLNKKENKLSRPFAATFSTSLIFVIVNETLRAFRRTIPAPLKRRERARRRVLPPPLLLPPCARRKIFTWSINESFEISKSYFLRISKEEHIGRERTYRDER